MSKVEQPISVSGQEDQLAVVRRDSNIRSYRVIKGIMSSRVVESLPLRVRCECAIQRCEEIIEVILSKRRELRRHYPRGFIIVPSHVDASQDIALCENADFCVIEKLKFTEAVKDL